MDVEDMGLPDDEFRRRLRELCLTEFCFQDLVTAAEKRNQLMDEIGQVMKKHNPSPYDDLVLPPIQITPEWLPEMIRGALDVRYMVGCSMLPWVIGLAQRLRQSNNDDAKLALKEVLAAIVAAEDDDLDILFVAKVIGEQLES